MHSVSYAWHALLSADLAFTPIGPSSTFLARLVGSPVNVPARTGIECGPTRPSVLGMNCPAMGD